MSKLRNTNTEFKQVVLLIEEARNRAFHKVNEELVLLYFKVGNLVSEKVSAGAWGENTVEELASFIQDNCPGLKGFNRRGLYRMKQFYELYTPESQVVKLWWASQNVSAVGTHLQKPENEVKNIVSLAVTQFQSTDNQAIKFVSPIGGATY